MNAECYVLNLKWLLLVVLSSSFSAQAAVSGYDIEIDRLYANGASFGSVGQYREIRGTLYFEVDPQNSHNQIIVGLDQAPLNSEGLVTFSSDFLLLSPLNPENSNQVAIIDIPNRGNQIMTRFNNPGMDSDGGDNFLFVEGYTQLWLGWEDDIGSGFRISLPRSQDSELSVSGLGFAAVRDLASWIKYSPDALASSPYLLSFGLSQSGRFLRNYLYLGFNSDEQGRQVFDGMMPHIAGASRIDLNRPGANPASQGQYTATSFPFTDAAFADPVSGIREGALENVRAIANQPKIFYTNSSVEYWGGGRVAAMIHTTPDAQQDIVLQDNVRIYLLAGTQHGPSAFPPGQSASRQLPNNPLNYYWRLRALLLALTEWVSSGVEPPASAYPRLSDGTLVPVATINFPAITDHAPLNTLNAGIRVPNLLLDNGAGAGAPLPLLVPQVNQDGNEIGGVPAPELLVPMATYTGWNFNNPAVADPLRLFPLSGSYIPFPLTAEQREANQDPRLSITERYSSKAEFLNLIRQASASLVAQRYLLERDVEAVEQRASAHWDYLMDAP